MATHWNPNDRIEPTPAGRDYLDALETEEEEEELEPVRRPLPNPRFCPSTCGKCGIGNIYGPPACFDKQCPNPLPVPKKSA